MKRVWIGMTAAALVLASGACSKTEEDKGAAPKAAPAAQASKAAQTAPLAAAARVEVASSNGLFWFVPRRCNIGTDPDSGAIEYSIEGAGQAPDGQPIYVTVTDEDGNPATGPEIRINVGTDQPRKTPDVVWIANEGSADQLRVPAAKASVQGQVLTVEGAVFAGKGDARMAATAPIRIDCTGR